jgi:CIC family chloride channel protein
MFMSSAAMGGALAMVLNLLIPSAHLSPGAFALVAMGAVFGAASRATFSFIIFGFEITRIYEAVLPLMLVSVIADGISMLLMPKASIMTEKLRRRGLRIHQEYEIDVLQHTLVSETMDREPPFIRSDIRVSELADQIARGEPGVSRHQALLVLDPDAKLAGMITRGDVLRALEKDSSLTVLDAASLNVVVTYPDETLHDAVSKMLRYNVGRLPVVDRKDDRHVVGYLGRPGIMAARLRRLDEEHVREPGWIRGLRGSAVRS